MRYVFSFLSADVAPIIAPIESPAKGGMEVCVREHTREKCGSSMGSLPGRDDGQKIINAPFFCRDRIKIPLLSQHACCCFRFFFSESIYFFNLMLSDRNHQS